MSSDSFSLTYTFVIGKERGTPVQEDCSGECPSSQVSGVLEAPAPFVFSEIKLIYPFGTNLYPDVHVLEPGSIAGTDGHP